MGSKITNLTQPNLVFKQKLEKKSKGSVYEVVVVVLVVGQTDGFISSRTLAYDCLCTFELCTASMIATS